MPDLITTAKGIAGGLPLAAVTGRAEIMDAVHTGGLGGTYGGNPMACAAALGAIHTMRGAGPVRRRPPDRRRDAAAAARAGGAARPVGDVRGRGAMVAVELVQPGTTTPTPAATAAVAAACHRAGVVVLTCGTYGNVLRFLPPLVIPDHLLDEGLRVVEEAVTTPHLTAGRATTGASPASGSLT